MSNQTYEQKPGDGVVFANESNNPNAPAMKGTLTIPDNVKPGDKVQISMWRKTSKTGSEYFSLKAEKIWKANPENKI